MSDDDDFWLGPSDPETQFVPQEDDDETLWEVIEITAEKGKLYKVRWKGIDPSTQKPWPQSWVAKHDCTDDLVREWKSRQAKKKKVSERESGISKKSVGSSKATTSVGSTRRSTSTAATLGLGSANTPATSSAFAKTGAKRKHESTSTTTSTRISAKSAFPTVRAERDARRSTSTAATLGLGSVNTPAASSASAKTGDKRKHVESTSTTTSARISAKSAFPTVRAEGDARPNNIYESVLPPRKKRKLEVEIVNLDHSSSSAEVDDKGKKPKVSQVITTDDDSDEIEVYVESESEVELGSGHSKLQRQNLSQPAEEREEEQDDRIESLSDIDCRSPISSPIHNQEDQRTPTPSVRAHGQAHKQQVTAEEIILAVSSPQPETERAVDSFPISARITSELYSPSKKSSRSSRSSSRSSSSVSTDYPPPEMSVPDKVSRSRAESVASSGSHSLTERGTKPINITPSIIPRFKGVDSSGPSTGVRIPTPPKSTDSGANDEEDGDKSPILSPCAKERLEQFDRALLQIELGKGKEKDQWLEDNAILGREKKSRETEEEEKDGEMVATSGGQEHLWTPQTTDKPGASQSKLLEIEKKKKTQPLFLLDEDDSDTNNSHARLKPQAELEIQNGKSGSKERDKEQLNKRQSSHHSSDSSRLADSEEEEEEEGDNSSSTDVGSADTKHAKKTFDASSRTVTKALSKPQSTNAAQASLPPSTTAVRGSRSNSFVHDIIPETDESRSQSQETDMQVPTVLVPSSPSPPVNMKFALESHMKSKTPQPKPRSLSRTFTAVEILAPGVQLGIDMDVGDDVDERLDSEMDDVDETVTSNKIVDLAMTMESSGPIPRISSRTPKSRSRSFSVSSQKSKNLMVLMEPETPLTVSIHRESFQTSQPADAQRGSAENSPHLGAVMHPFNTKSEEISKLENQLSSERRTNEDLLQQLSALRQHITESTNNTQSAIMTLDQELAEARVLQTDSWENERATLTLNIETAIRGKVSAEQDRDFFREQYAMASGFVSSVRDENAELEKQIKIATDQAHSGVGLIKTTFESRTKLLEEDVRAWRRIAEFLIEKDQRTNDDIRRRAAEEPELRARCDRQESALEHFSERLLQLEMDLDEKERLFVEAVEARKTWQETTVKLNSDLNEAKAKLERIGKVGIGAERLKNPPPTPEFTYRCNWKSVDSNVDCEAVFFNILEYQDHTGRHLQLD